VDAFSVITSKRDTRRYADRPVADEAVGRVLDAGRLSGSAKNRQPWRFLVVESPELRERLAGCVYEPGNVRGAQVVVAIVSSASMDVGRCMQNMMLAAWNEGIASCPNGIADADGAGAALGLAGEERPAVILTFGYPANGRSPADRTPEEWSAAADRKPLDELVERL